MNTVRTMSDSVEPKDAIVLDEQGAHRRSAPPYPLFVPLRATLGRVPAVIIDLSLGGARLRHRAPRPNEEFSLRFSWGGQPFESRALIVSTQLREIDSTGRPSYETRIRFGVLTADATRTLRRVLGALYDARIGEWLANLRGDSRPPLPVHNEVPPAYFVCTLVDGIWHTHRVNTAEDPPVDGFIVPVTLDEGELKRICTLFAILDEDGRELLRLFVACLEAFDPVDCMLD